MSHEDEKTLADRLDEVEEERRLQQDADRWAFFYRLNNPLPFVNRREQEWETRKMYLSLISTTSESMKKDAW